MNPSHTRRRLLQAGLAFCGAALLPTARACEFFCTSLRIEHPWTRASAPGASTARVCMTFDEVLRTDRLIHVETPVAAAAEMGGPQRTGTAINFVIPEGQESELTEEGVHILLTGLRHPLEEAREYPLTLVFEHAGRVEVRLSVDYAHMG